MEGGLSQGGMIPPSFSYGGLDLQGQHRQPNHPLPQQGLVRPSIREGFPLTMGTMQTCDHTVAYNRGERGKNSASDEDEPSFADEGVDDHHDAVTRGKKGSSPWHRVKWTDKMVRILITAVSYCGEDVASEGGASRRKFAILQKKGKWKSVSKVMAERGFSVSPQQCEDKFNDLNKRYKKLNDVLGRGTSCEVVENPALLDMIDYLSEKEKDDVRKILSSKHLFYEEMCSYHNGNRLHLPHDPALQHSLQMALRSRDDHDHDHDHDDDMRNPHDDFDEDDQDAETDDHDGYDDGYALTGTLGKRMRQGQGHEDACFGNSNNPLECNKVSYRHAQSAQANNKSQMFMDGTKSGLSQQQWFESRGAQLEEKKLEIQVEMLELEEQRLKWERFSRKKDSELERLRMENEEMKLENERLALQLKRKGIGTLL